MLHHLCEPFMFSYHVQYTFVVYLWHTGGAQCHNSTDKINKYFTIGYNHINKYLLIVPPHVYDLIFCSINKA